jgi:hypothetical protein
MSSASPATAPDFDQILDRLRAAVVLMEDSGMNRGRFSHCHAQVKQSMKAIALEAGLDIKTLFAKPQIESPEQPSQI